MPWTFGAFLLASLSIVGLPPLGGTWSKWLLLQGAAAADQPIMLAVMLVGSLLSLGYLLPIPVRAFFRSPAIRFEHGEAPRAVLWPLLLTALACLALFFGAEPLIAPLRTALEVG